MVKTFLVGKAKMKWLLEKSWT